MKRIISLSTAALLGFGLLAQASAAPGHDRGQRPHFDRGPSHHYQPPRLQRHHAPPPRHSQHRHSRHDRHNWVGPATVLTIGGLALGSALYYNQQPTVIYQNNVTSPPSDNWFYCRSSGQYYPYTQACPEGWVAVRP